MMSDAALPFTAASFQIYLDEKRLMGSQCTGCGLSYLPPRAICPHCQSESLQWVEFGQTGRLAAFTSIYIAPTFMVAQGFGRQNPYLSAIVELDEGVKVSARLLGFDPQDPAAIQVGEPLRCTFIEIGGKTQLAFEPLV